MNGLLDAAARVEAAVGKYISVQETTDKNKWRSNFEKEFVSHVFTRSLGLILIFSSEK